MTISRVRWTEEETQNLLHMYHKDMDIEFMARVLGRTDAAIYAMIYRLKEEGRLINEPVAQPKQLTLTEENKPKKPAIKKKREVYVLVRQAKPSWLERARCYLNGTKWESVDKVVKNND